MGWRRGVAVVLTPVERRRAARTDCKSGSLKHQSAVTFGPLNAFAPVLGDGRFTQPGADGGERMTLPQSRATKWCGEHSAPPRAPY